MTLLPSKSHIMKIRKLFVLSEAMDILLYYAALHCSVLYCTTSHCTVLYCSALQCTVLYCAVLHSTVTYSPVLYCSLCTYIFRAALRFRGGILVAGFGEDIAVGALACVCVSVRRVCMCECVCACVCSVLRSR